MKQVIVILLVDANLFLRQINEFHKFNLLKPAQYFRESMSKTLQLLSFLQPSQPFTMGQGGEHWDAQRRISGCCLLICRKFAALGTCLLVQIAKCHPVTLWVLSIAACKWD